MEEFLLINPAEKSTIRSAERQKGERYSVTPHVPHCGHGTAGVGAILAALSNNGHADDTVVIFVSDHGMPLPFAKSSLYPNGVTTPWLVRWPGVIKPGSIDTAHKISAIDFMPSILDIAGVQIPSELRGRSIVPLLKGQAQARLRHLAHCLPP